MWYEGIEVREYRKEKIQHALYYLWQIGLEEYTLQLNGDGMKGHAISRDLYNLKFRKQLP